MEEVNNNMDTILLCSGYPPATTYIHNAFIEDYMLSANGSYVKVYIYLLKCIQTGEKDLSISSLADKMDNTEKDILRALNYWEKNHLIHLVKGGNNGEITGIEILNPGSQKKASAREIPAKETASPEKPAEPPQTINTAATKEPPDIKITASQTKRLSGDDDFVWTSRVIESYVSRPLKPGEVQLISYLYDDLGFSPDLLLYLYEYCISLGKTSVNYIQAVALSWDKQNIKTPEEAKNASSNYKATYTAIARAFALGRPLAPAEKDFASRWLNEWHMDLSVVLDACNRTMLKFQKADFNYTNGTIEKWHKNNIHTLQDVKKADEEYAKKKKAAPDKKQYDGTQQNSHRDKNQFNNFMQREVSKKEIDELEKKLLAR